MGGAGDGGARARWMVELVVACTAVLALPAASAALCEQMCCTATLLCCSRVFVPLPDPLLKHGSGIRVVVMASVRVHASCAQRGGLGPGENDALSFGVDESRHSDCKSRIYSRNRISMVVPTNDRLY